MKLSLLNPSIDQITPALLFMIAVMGIVVVMGIVSLVLYAFKYKPGKDNWIWKIVALLYTVVMLVLLAAEIITSLFFPLHTPVTISVTIFTNVLIIPIILGSIYFCQRFAFYNDTIESLSFTDRSLKFFRIPPAFRLIIITTIILSLSLSCIPFILADAYHNRGDLSSWWYLLWGLTIVLLLIFIGIMIEKKKYSVAFRFYVIMGMIFILFISVLTMSVPLFTAYD